MNDEDYYFDSNLGATFRYIVTDKKGNDKAPDFNLILRTEEIKQESPKDNIDPFKAFGEMIENEEIPF